MCVCVCVRERERERYRDSTDMHRHLNYGSTSGGLNDDHESVPLTVVGSGIGLPSPSPSPSSTRTRRSTLFSSLSSLSSLFLLCTTLGLIVIVVAVASVVVVLTIMDDRGPVAGIENSDGRNSATINNFEQRVVQPSITSRPTPCENSQYKERYDHPLPEDWKQQLVDIMGGDEGSVITPQTLWSSSSKEQQDVLVSSLFWNQIIRINDNKNLDCGSQSERGSGSGRPAKAVLRVTSEQQIVDLLMWLVGHEQKFSIKSGGHNKAGYSYCPNCFVLDLAPMNRIIDDGDDDTITTTTSNTATATTTTNTDDDDNSRLVRIQPGLHGLELIRHTIPMSNASTGGYGAVVGVCPTVALGGFVLGGGYGWLSRQYGLASDNLISVRLIVMESTVIMTPTVSTVTTSTTSKPNMTVIANRPTMVPTVIDVNESTYPDLFWAMKGAGGGSFGVVTEMTYKVYPGYQDMNYNGILVVELADVPKFLVLLANMDRSGELPRQFTMIVEMYSIPRVGIQTGVDETSHDGKNTSFWFSDIGDLSAKNIESPVAFGCVWVSKTDDLVEGRKFMQETLPSIAGDRALMTVQDFPWTKNGVTGGEFPPSPPQYVECFSGFVTDATLETMTNIVQKLHAWSKEWYPIIQPDTELWGGAISDVEANSTSFPHRRAIFNVAAIVYVDVNMENSQQVFHDAVMFLKSNFHVLGLNGTYSNYQQRSLSREEYPRRYFGENIERLEAIKRKYDPQMLFDYRQGIPLVPV